MAKRFIRGSSKFVGLGGKKMGAAETMIWKIGRDYSHGGNKLGLTRRQSNELKEKITEKFITTGRDKFKLPEKTVVKELLNVLKKNKKDLIEIEDVKDIRDFFDIKFSTKKILSTAGDKKEKSSAKVETPSKESIPEKSSPEALKQGLPGNAGLAPSLLDSQLAGQDSDEVILEEDGSGNKTVQEIIRHDALQGLPDTDIATKPSSWKLSAYDKEEGEAKAKASDVSSDIDE